MRQTTESVNKELPALLIFYSEKGDKEKGEQLFIFKDKVFPLCAKLLADVRPQVQKAILIRWQEILRDFHREDAMDQDQAFEKLVESCVYQFAPTIGILIRDKRFYLINAESERARGLSSEASMIFSNNGTLLPLSTLLLLKRKALLADARLLLPFWYSIPILTAIIVFFKNLNMGTAKTKSTRKYSNSAAEEAGQTEVADRVQRQALQSAAREYKSSVVPMGYTLDTYLEELESRWRRLLDKESKQKLVENVQSLIRDKLRWALRQRKHQRITQKTFASIADTIMLQSPTLEQLDTREAVHLYIQLYIIKLIEK
jgi:hypothetical protein